MQLGFGGRTRRQIHLLSKMGALVAAVGAITVTSFGQMVIGLDFVGGQSGASTTSMSRYESAGVVSQSRWNNLTGSSGSGTTITNSSGATVSGVTVTYSSTNTWADPAVSDTAGNNRMMRGYLDINTNGASTTVTVNGLGNLGYYDLYVYTAGDGNNRVGKFTVGSQSYWMNDNATFSGTYVRGTGEVDPGSYQNATAGNYMIFSDLTGSSVSLTATGAYAADGVLRAPVNGIQIVQLPASYWDINGSTSGAGGASPNGTWSSSATNWSSSANGNVATGAWTPGNLAVFSAGTNATGNYTVTVSGTQTSSSVIVEEGNPTFSNGTIALNGTTPQFNVATGSTATVNSLINSTMGLYKAGAGTLVVGNGANAYTGPTVVRAGTLTVGASNAIPNSTALTVENGATFDLNNYTASVGVLTGSGTLRLGGGTLTAGSGNVSSTFSGSFASGDTGTFAKTGTGTLTLGSGVSLAGGNLTLSGGTFSLGGFSSDFNSLMVTSNSILDFSGVSTLNLASLTINAGAILTITNWSDAVDFFYSINDPGAANLGRILFSGYSSSDTKWQSWDHQITPVPEPSTYGAAFAVLSILGAGILRRRRHA